MKRSMLAPLLLVVMILTAQANQPLNPLKNEKEQLLSEKFYDQEPMERPLEHNESIVPQGQLLRSPDPTMNVSSDWVVKTPTQHHNEIIYAYGNITVTTGASLSLTNCSIYFMTNGTNLFSVRPEASLLLNTSVVTVHENTTATWALEVDSAQTLSVYNSDLSQVGASTQPNQQFGVKVNNTSLQWVASNVNDGVAGVFLSHINHSLILNSRFSNIPDGLVVTSSSNITISSVVTEGTSSSGFQGNDINDGVIKNSVFGQPDFSRYSVMFSRISIIVFDSNELTRGLQVQEGQGIQISNNILRDPDGGEANPDYGVELVDVTDSVVSQNTLGSFFINSGFGYGVSIRGTTTHNITIADNLVESFRGWGVEVEGVEGISIQGNIIQRGLTNNYYGTGWQRYGGGIGLLLTAGVGMESILNNTFSGLPTTLVLTDQTSPANYANTFIALNNFECSQNVQNTTSVPLPGTTYWYWPAMKVGNYWSDNNYTQDLDNNSILDESYEFAPGTTDLFPLAHPNFVPEVTTQVSLYIIENGVNQTLNWTITDHDPLEYSLYQNNSFICSGSLTEAATIITDLDPLTEGHYLYEIQIQDRWGNSKKRSEIIYVEPPDFDPPGLTLPPNLTFYEVEPKRELVFPTSELHPDQVSLIINSSDVSEINKTNPTNKYLTFVGWGTDNLTIQLGNLFEENYTLNITLTDILGHKTSQNLTIYVIDEGPLIQGQEVVEVSQDSQVTLVWNIYDIITDVFIPKHYPKELDLNSLVLRQQGTQLIEGVNQLLLSQTRSRISYTFDTNGENVSIGVVEFILEANDTSGRFQTFQTNVSIVDTRAPTCYASETNPTEVVEFDPPQWFNWTTSDRNPHSYNLTLYSYDFDNRSIVYASHDLAQDNSWGGENLSYLLNPLDWSVGTYRLEMKVVDQGNNSVTAAGGVFTLLDGMNITVWSVPENSTLEYGTEREVTWNYTDRNPTRYQIRLNGSLVERGDWNGTAISMNVTEYLWSNETPTENRLGYYELFVQVYDQGNNQANDTLGILVRDTTLPLITNPPASELTLLHQTSSDVLNFSVTELLPDKYFLVVNDTVVQHGPYNHSVIISYYQFAVGPNNVTLSLTDLGNNTMHYTFVVMLVDPLAPIARSPQPNRTLTYPQNRFSLSWDLRDVRPSYYTLKVNNKTFDQEMWERFIYVFVVLPIGTNYLLFKANDTSGNVYEEEFVVVVLDVDAPIVLTKKPLGMLEILDNESVTLRVEAEDVEPGTYDVKINGSVVTSNSWSEIIVVRLENLEVGFLNTSVEVFDKSGNMAEVFFKIRVLSSTDLHPVETPPNTSVDPLSIFFELLSPLLALTALYILVKGLMLWRKRRK